MSFPKEKLLFCREGEQFSTGEYAPCFRNLAARGYTSEGFLVVGEKFEFAYFKSVGVFATTSAVIVVFPKNYPDISGLEECNSESDPRVEDSRLLVSVLRKYKQSASHDQLSKDSSEEDEVADHLVALACEILEDYARHGTLVKTENECSVHEGGRVDWTRTIKARTPVIASKKALYLDPVVRRQSVKIDHPVTTIHQYVVGKCFQDWGWLLGFDQISQNSSLPFEYQSALRHLDNALATTFVSREIRAIKLLRQYLLMKSSSGDPSKSDVLATKFFAVVWEDACKALFGDQFGELQNLVPQPIWKNANGKPIPNYLQPSQRPDLLVVRNQKFYVLDAKYYAVPARWPGWHDIVKQLFYGTTLARSLPLIRKEVATKQAHERSAIDDFLASKFGLIINAFLFPGQHDGIRCEGYVDLPNDPEIGRIVSFSVGPRLALRAYLGYPMMSTIDDLFGFIDRQVFDVYESAIPINLEVTEDIGLRRYKV